MHELKPFVQPAAAEYSVWSELLEEWLMQTPPPLILIGRRSGTDLEHKPKPTIGHSIGEGSLAAETVVSFIAANKAQSHWERQFRLPAPTRYRVVSQRIVDDCRVNRQDRGARLRIPPLTPLFMLSRVGFDPTGTQALVHVATVATAGDLTVGGITEVIMHYRRDHWLTASQKTLRVY